MEINPTKMIKRQSIQWMNLFYAKLFANVKRFSFLMKPLSVFFKEYT